MTYRGLKKRELREVIAELEAYAAYHIDRAKRVRRIFWRVRWDFGDLLGTFTDRKEAFKFAKTCKPDATAGMVWVARVTVRKAEAS